MLLKNADLLDIAHAIRPHITPLLEEHGFVPDSDITRLSYLHAGHRIGSERSLRMVQDYLCEI